MISFTCLDIDPIHLFFKVFSLNLTPGGLGSFILLVFRLAFTTLLLYAVARSISFVMIWAIIVLKISLHCIELARKEITTMRNSSNSLANFH
jgi:hypothetical protein